MSWEISRQEAREQTATSLAAEQFHEVSWRIIESTQDDPAQLRKLIYELARARLQREEWLKNPPVGILEMRRCFHALELAIEGMENLSAAEDELRALLSRDRLIANAANANLSANQAVITIDCVGLTDRTSTSRCQCRRLRYHAPPPVHLAKWIWSTAMPPVAQQRCP
jgi:hypothetical protein